MIALDAFCGDGGMTDGMLEAGFEVHGIDTVRRPGYRGKLAEVDIRHAVIGSELGIAWMHGSPPCTRFSLARCNRGTDPPTDADLDLLRAFIDHRDRAKPRFWSVENVRGAVPWFKPILGEPRFRHGAFYFWGNFPPFLVERAGLKKGIYGSKSPVTARLGKQTKPRDPWASAKVPIEIARPMARAIMAQLRTEQEVSAEGTPSRYWQTDAEVQP